MTPKFLLGVFGNATAMALFLSPTPTFVRIFRAKSTEEFSSLPYVCTLFNCLLWVLYGLPIVKPHSMLIITINIFGVVMELFFITLFVVFATKASKMKVLSYLTIVAVLYAGITMITLFTLHTLSLRQMVVGSLCVVVAVTMYAAPLSVMGLVIRTKSVEYMPFTLSLCNFVNSAVWTAYSLVTKDIFVGIPNGLGCISGAVQLLLYALYCRNTQKNTEKPGEIQKSEALYLKKSNTATSVDIEKNLSLGNSYRDGCLKAAMQAQSETK